MAIIKCKMCGGDLVLVAGQSIAECEYCGSRQTVPAADSEKKLNLFASAHKLRAACEFDRAMSIYDTIRAEFPDEAEAYWGLVLCKYGIEYVDDPATEKKIPTCHRSSFDSILEDTDFEQALENADAVARRLYREEAMQIEDIRQGILSVSASEAPYDIFICYKETDENGDRTLDSVLAQDVYNALTDKGYRVFFSRITLEDKLGVQYEPYIFAALNSAKIMLAVGTDYEYYHSVWVKNEWSRFLKLMSKDRSKYLFPCYKNLTPYDLPKEFRHLQGQDLGKIGAIQDLLRGIEKCLPQATSGVRKQTDARPVQSAAEVPPVTIRTAQAPQTVTPQPIWQETADEEPQQKLKSIGKRIALLLIGVAVAAIALFLAVTKVIIPENTYKEALRLLSNQRLEEAAQLFESIPEYKDAYDRATAAREQAAEERIEYLESLGIPISDNGYVLFGNYRKKGDAAAVAEPIEWFPLAVSGSKVLLISRYALDCQPGLGNRLWKDSALRAWLNTDFFGRAFTNTEQLAILETKNDNPVISSFYGDTFEITGDQGTTTDRVFLLSAPEVVSYFGNMPERYTTATGYAKKNGAYIAGNGNTWWALRTDNANFVGAESGFGTGSGQAVRPALWLDLTADFSVTEPERTPEKDPEIAELIRNFDTSQPNTVEKVQAMRNSLREISGEELKQFLPGEWLEKSKFALGLRLEIILTPSGFGIDKQQAQYGRRWSLSDNGQLIYEDVTLSETGELLDVTCLCYEVRELAEDVYILYLSQIYEDKIRGEANVILIREGSLYADCLDDQKWDREYETPVYQFAGLWAVTISSKSYADRVLDLFAASDRSEDAFRTLIGNNIPESYMLDSLSFYTVVPGQLTEAVDSWCFDPQNRIGDAAVIQTEYGYMLCYLADKTPQITDWLDES